MSWKTSIVKITTTQSMIYTGSAIPIKISDIFTEIKKPILKFTWNLKGRQICKTNWARRTKLEDTHFADFKIFCKATVSKTVQSWHKDRHTDPRDREPRHKPSRVGQMMKGAETIQWGRESSDKWSSGRAHAKAGPLPNTKQKIKTDPRPKGKSL